MAYPGILFGGGGGFQQIQLRTEGTGSGGNSPLVSGSGGICNLVQEISFHIVKFVLMFGTLRLFMMTTNLFVIANVKNCEPTVVLEFYCLFFPNILGCWRPKFSNF